MHAKNLSQELEDEREHLLHQALDDSEGMASSAARYRRAQQEMAARTLLDELGAPSLDEDEQRYLWRDRRRLEQFDPEARRTAEGILATVLLVAALVTLIGLLVFGGTAAP